MKVDIIVPANIERENVVRQIILLFNMFTFLADVTTEYRSIFVKKFVGDTKWYDW